uniref:Uncharacterized protein n=1 Tax=Lepeophtheirus salmonis TaxID=72036 RepID=A0A0K2VGT8_LEPSM
MEIGECSKCLVFKVANMKNDGENLFKKGFSGWHNLKRPITYLDSGPQRCTPLPPQI